MGFGKMHSSAVCGLAAAMVAAGAGSVGAATFTGNGGTGFGGGVGNSTLTVTDGGSTINFSVQSATNTFDGNNLVFYFDTVAGGVNDNSTFTDTADPGRRAISGLSDNGRSLVTLPAGFGADYGVSVEIGSFAGLFNLSTPSNFGFVASGGIAGSGTGPITFSFNKADLGLSGGGTLNFAGTLISGTAYRSNETYGASVTTPASPGDAPNGGFTGTQVFASGYSFAVAAVPEPTTLAALAGAGIALLRRRRTA